MEMSFKHGNALPETLTNFGLLKGSGLFCYLMHSSLYAHLRDTERRFMDARYNIFLWRVWSHV